MQHDPTFLAAAQNHLGDRAAARVSIAELTALVSEVRRKDRLFTEAETRTLMHLRDLYQMTPAARRHFRQQVPEARQYEAETDDDFAAYHAWLTEKLPHYAALLKTEPDPEGVAAIERTLDKTLPTDLRRWFTAHPGQDPGDGLSGYLLGLDVLTPAAALVAREELLTAAREDELNDNWRGTVFPERAIQNVYYDPLWLPLFTDTKGNYVGADLNHGRYGTYGQLINFGTDETTHFVLADGLTALWVFLAERSESGDLEQALFTDPEDGQRRAAGLYPDSHLTEDMQYLIVE